MKNTNFERVEHTHGNVRTERIVVHTKKRYSHWRLKILSAVLAFLIWLVIANVTEHRANNNDNAAPSCMGEATVETI